MSNKLRNPFKMRASEKIESDVNFLRLFSPEVLNVLINQNKKDQLWGELLFIRSSPGAGKTSLLRIFEPNLLHLVLNHRDNNEYNEVYSKLLELNVLDNKQVKAIGVTIKCTRNYELLEDIEASDQHKKRLFYSLLNVRIVLATLKRITEFKKVSYPDDLDKLMFNYDDHQNHFKKINFPCSGKALYEWASNLEVEIYELLDSFLPINHDSIEGHSELFSVYTLSPESFRFNNETFFEKIIFMFDDTQKLSYNQRKFLVEYIAEQRKSCNIWISERLDKIREFSSYLNRDYNEINLEKFWVANNKAFKKTLTQISDTRASYSTEGITSFKEYLNDLFDEKDYIPKLKKAIEKQLIELEKIVSFNPKFSDWLFYLKTTLDGEVSQHRALLILKAQILIGRDDTKRQLDFAFPLSTNELLVRNATLDNTANLFLNRFYKIPYYYGFNNLTKLSSHNIEQFLSFSSEIFEGILSNSLIGDSAALSISRQEKIIKKVVSEKWLEMDTLLPNAQVVKTFIDNLGKFLMEKTFAKNASYAPGLTGFALLEQKKVSLFHEESWEETPAFDILRETLKTCLQYNIFEIRKIYQGEKGKQWDVFYLNRWLCVKYNLPLQVGEWNKIQPKTALTWLKK